MFFNISKHHLRAIINDAATKFQTARSSPQSPKRIERDDSTVPVGFALERQSGKHGKSAALWRCGEISRHPVTKEYRHCSRYFPKLRCLAHQQRGDYKFLIS
jgi:hypothetical protein